MVVFVTLWFMCILAHWQMHGFGLFSGLVPLGEVGATLCCAYIQFTP
jgi:hypothetical protein